MCLCNQAVESGTGLMVVMPHGWEGIWAWWKVIADCKRVCVSQLASAYRLGSQPNAYEYGTRQPILH